MASQTPLWGWHLDWWGIISWHYWLALARAWRW
jgi:hypothetical protein